MIAVLIAVAVAFAQRQVGQHGFAGDGLLTDHHQGIHPGRQVDVEAAAEAIAYLKNMARRYRDNARLAIEDEVKTHLERGKKDFAAGKLRDARGHYEAILRLLFSDQSNPAYAEAKGQLEKVRSEMGDE